MALDSLRFAHRFDQISGSAIREIFKMIAKPGMISFAGGNPAASALPDAECAEIARDVLQMMGSVFCNMARQRGIRRCWKACTPMWNSSLGAPCLRCCPSPAQHRQWICSAKR